MSYDAEATAFASAAVISALVALVPPVPAAGPLLVGLYDVQSLSLLEMIRVAASNCDATFTGNCHFYDGVSEMIVEGYSTCVSPWRAAEAPYGRLEGSLLLALFVACAHALLLLFATMFADRSSVATPGSAVHWPSWTFRVVLALFCGIATESVRLLSSLGREGTEGAAQLFFGGVGVILACLVMLSIWRFNSVHLNGIFCKYTFHLRPAASSTLCDPSAEGDSGQRSRGLLDASRAMIVPRGFWTPADDVKQFGAFFDPVDGGAVTWAVFPLSKSLLLAVAVSLPSVSADVKYCICASVFILYAVIVGVRRPFRASLGQFLSVLQNLLSAVIALSAVVPQLAVASRGLLIAFVTLSLMASIVGCVVAICEQLVFARLEKRSRQIPFEVPEAESRCELPTASSVPLLSIPKHFRWSPSGLSQVNARPRPLHLPRPVQVDDVGVQTADPLPNSMMHFDESVGFAEEVSRRRNAIDACLRLEGR